MENLTYEQFLDYQDKKAALLLSAVDPNLKGQYKFDDDLYGVGKLGVEFIKNFLIFQGFKIVRENDDYKFDILARYKNNNHTYEVKTDTKVSETGNWFIEFECRKKPSVINVTEAEFFTLYSPQKKVVLNIETKALKNLIEENDFRIGIGGDEGSNTKGYLIPDLEFRTHFNVYDVREFPPRKL
jgi:hypothetical protein